MKVTLLKEIEEGCIDAVIISNVTEPSKIQLLIDKVKATKQYEYQWEDLLSCLPDDCEVHDKWSGDLGIVRY